MVYSSESEGFLLLIPHYGQQIGTKKYIKFNIAIGNDDEDEITAENYASTTTKPISLIKRAH